MMKVKVKSRHGTRTVAHQCPYCSGLGMQLAHPSNDDGKSCSTCKRSHKTKNSPHENGLNGNIFPQKVSVVAVGKNKIDSSAKSSKTPSLFGRLFSKSDKGKRTIQDVGNVAPESHPYDSQVNSPLQFRQSVTFLEVKGSPKLSASNPNLDRLFPSSETSVQYLDGDLCTKCNSNPAQLSVTDSKGLKTDMLCRFCHNSSKKSSDKNQPTVTSLSFEPETVKRSNSATMLSSEDAKRTVIVVNDGKGSRQTNSSYFNEETNKSNHNSAETRLLQMLEDFKTTVLNSGSIEPSSTPKESSPILSVSQTTTTKVTAKRPEHSKVGKHSLSSFPGSSSKLRSHGGGVEKESQKSNEKGLPVTVLSLYSNKVQRSSTFADGHKNFKQMDNIGRSNQLIPSTSSAAAASKKTSNFVSEEEPPMFFDDEEEIDEELQRPAPFNPDYRSTLGKASVLSLKMPSELEAVRPYQGGSMESRAEGIIQSSRSANLQLSPVNEYFHSSRNTSSIRHEDVSKVIDPNRQVVYLLRSFGRHSEISTQPGGFSDPTTLKLSGRQASSNLEEPETMVVTDPKLSNVQVFDVKGECLALVKVKGVKSCCQVGFRQLVVATDEWIALFDYNGTEKGKVNLDVSRGGVNSVGPMKTRGSFVMVAQARMVSIFDCSSNFMVFVKKFESVNPNLPFKNIVDVAITSKEKLVILDSGAIGGTGAIYVIDISTGKPKSAIYPKHESCGPFKNPSALAVDRQNRILVADSGNARVLLLVNIHNQTGATPLDKNAKRAQIQVKTLTDLKLRGSSSGSDLTSAGMDVNNDDFVFLVVKGEMTAEIRIYSSH